MIDPPPKGLGSAVRRSQTSRIQPVVGNPARKKVGSFVSDRYLPQYNLNVVAAMESGSSRIVRVGVFEMDLDARELRKSGVRVRLQDQPFRVLALLVERPGEIVSREEIREKI